MQVETTLRDDKTAKARRKSRRQSARVVAQSPSRLPSQKDGRLTEKRTVSKAIRVQVASWNVGTLTGKARELAASLKRRRVDVACFQETRWKGEKSRQLGDGYKLIYYGKTNGHNGVGIALREHFAQNVVAVTRKTDRLMAVKVATHYGILNFISAYAPQVGCTDDEKDLFWDSLAKLMRDIPKDEDVYIGADLNGHVGEKCKQFSSVHGGHGLGTQNPEGKSILQFAEAENLVVANTWFQKKDEHKVTYSSGGKKTQIDYILVRREKLKHLKNCKALPAESETTQHRLLVADVEQAPKCKKKWVAKKKRIKWWKLNSNDPDVKIEVEKFAESAKEKLRCINEEMSVEEV